MVKRSFGAISVLVVIAPLVAGAATRELKTADIAGRWSGTSHAEKSRSILTLDIVACGTGWCGIKVEVGDKCGGTALKLNSGVVKENNGQFQGTLSLIPGTEPYTIHATIFPPDEGKPLEMQVTGDTSGNYQALQRSFPFEAALARVKDAVCKSPATVSSLQ